MSATSNGYRMGADGYFMHRGERFIPCGVNYWPASCGVELWQSWPVDEIQRDLDLVRSLGLNAIRFFLRWQDFEEQAGQYDDRMFDRLARLTGWCAERGIAAHPSLFIGFMSGGVFWPKWREGRNVFADPYMIERSAAFARRAAMTLAEHTDDVLAIDHGNEMCCLQDAYQAPPVAIPHWMNAVNRAIREAMPNALTISGNEQAQVLYDSGFRFGDQPGCDMYSMHGYPVPEWHSVRFDGMTDPLAAGLLPLYVKIARAFGPVMLQEFGTIITYGPQQQRTYLKAMLDGCWQAGANGFLYWCLHDVKAEIHPYLKHAFERSLGLVDGNGKIKPGLETFVEFARAMPQRPLPAAQRDAVGLYFPRYYYNRDVPQNPGNQPNWLAQRLVMADYMLRQAKRTTRIVRGDQPIPTDLKTLLITGAMLDLTEIDAMAEWVKQGGRLIWHGIDPYATCDRFNALLGAEPVDLRSPRKATVETFGRSWTLAHYPRRSCCQLEPRGAKVLAADERNIPLLLVHALGKGQVVWTVPQIEPSVEEVSSDPAARDPWAAWYEGVLQVNA